MIWNKCYTQALIICVHCGQNEVVTLSAGSAAIRGNCSTGFNCRVVIVLLSMFVLCQQVHVANRTCMLRESGANYLKILICLHYSDFFHSSNRWIYNVVFKYHAHVKLSPKINYVFVLDNAPNAFPGQTHTKTSICYAVENKCTTGQRHLKLPSLWLMKAWMHSPTGQSQMKLQSLWLMKV